MKTVWVKAHGGSNPSASASENPPHRRVFPYLAEGFVPVADAIGAQAQQSLFRRSAPYAPSASASENSPHRRVFPYPAEGFVPVADAIGAQAQQSLFRRSAPYAPSASASENPPHRRVFPYLAEGFVPVADAIGAQTHHARVRLTDGEKDPSCETKNSGNFSSATIRSVFRYLIRYFNN